jgi:ATP-dependent helicase/nuclease subunit A
MLEVAATGPRARDSWRRLRFVVDQARAWSEASSGGLRSYLAWATRQGLEVGRVAEAVLPESDANAVRVMTVHAAKGLEFPIVLLSGMSSQPGGRNGVRLLWTADGYQVALSAGVRTDEYATAVPVDEQMDDYERRRMLYVAATRARDHLVVSLHRGTRSSNTSAQLLADAGAAGHGALDLRPAPPAARPVPAESAPPPPPYAEFRRVVDAARRASRRVSAQSASGLEGTEPDVILADVDPGLVDVEAGLAKGPRGLDLPPWTKGRYGSAVGRAVHGVLQSVDLATGAGLDDAVRAQTVAEGVTDQAALVMSLARAALGSALVARAAAREHWRETYVGTVVDDGVVLEGYVDLIFRDDNGALVIVDYKTDAVPSGAIPSRVAYYRPQLDAYRRALEAATGAVVRTQLLFLTPTTAVAVPVAL